MLRCQFSPNRLIDSMQAQSKFKGPGIAEASQKRNKFGELTLPNLKIRYETTAIKTVYSIGIKIGKLINGTE